MNHYTRSLERFEFYKTTPAAE